MITNFIKEVKDFYETIYKTDFSSLSLHELQAIQIKMEQFYSNPILNLNDCEDSKFSAFLSYMILGGYSHFCLKDNQCDDILEFLNNLSKVSEINFTCQ